METGAYWDSFCTVWYAPRLSVEEIDGQNVLVIWVPSGINRPYAAPADVTARQKKPVYYIRYGTSSVEAKGEQLDELRDMANRVPFDDRGNPDIKLRDISSLLLRDYLIKVDSKLQYEDLVGSLERVLEQMDLYEGPSYDSGLQLRSRTRCRSNRRRWRRCGRSNVSLPVSDFLGGDRIDGFGVILLTYN